MAKCPKVVKNPEFQEFCKYEWPNAGNGVAKSNKILTKGLVVKGQDKLCSDTKCSEPSWFIHGIPKIFGRL